MLADAEKGRFKFLFVDSTSRFTRGGCTDFWWLIAELKKRGVLVYSRYHRMLVLKSNSVVFSVSASQDREHNIKMARDVTRSSIRNVKDRHCEGGAEPLGRAVGRG